MNYCYATSEYDDSCVLYLYTEYYKPVPDITREILPVFVLDLKTLGSPILYAYIECVKSPKLSCRIFACQT